MTIIIKEDKIEENNISFEEYIDLENQKNGEIYPFETLDLIILLKEKKWNIK